VKGIVNILELLLAGVILMLAFIHFFPQYSIKNQWSYALLEVYARDTLKTIDNLDNTYDYALADGVGNEFDNFMNRIYSIQHTDKVFVWWKDIENLPLGMDSQKPYFTEAKEETIVDVVDDGGTFRVYSFTLGLGYPY